MANSTHQDDYDDAATPEFHDAFSIGGETDASQEEAIEMSVRPASSVYDMEELEEGIVPEEEGRVARKRRYTEMMDGNDVVAQENHIWTRSTEGSPVIINMPNPTDRRVLVIAGSDSSGGAGIEADQRVLTLHKCFALTAITALTAQNTTGVDNVLPTPPSFVVNAINTVWDDVGVDVVKIGMLSSAGTVSAVARALQQRKDVGADFSIVLDPVMKSTSGSQLLPPKAVSVLRHELLPLANIVTPNIPEALLLVSRTGGSKPPPTNLDQMVALAKDVYSLAKKPWVLLKGGHFEENVETVENGEYTDDRSMAKTVIDVLYDGYEVKLLEKDFIPTKNTHGTGCSLASAIAANLAIGLDLAFAVVKASSYIERGIKNATEWQFGRGHGPIDHWS